ncbi:MAG: transglutaminase-like domain-containing protein, partial [Bacteroidota bacterium]
MKKTVLLISSCFLSFLLSGQDKELFDAMVKKYPNSPMVGLNFLKNIELNVEEGKIKIIEKTKEETILLNDDAISYRNYSIYSNSFVKTKNILSKTLVPKGKGYKSTTNENIEVQKDNSSSSFFDDQKKHIVYFENIEKGAIRSISYERTYEEPRFFGDEYLCDFYPSEKREINIKCAKSITLAVKFFNDSTSAKKLVITEDSKYKYYSLKLDNTTECKNFRGSPGIKWYLPHVVFYITSYNDGKETKDYLNNIVSLSNWYSSVIKHLPLITNKELISITDSLTANAKSESEMVKNIFYWVQKNIKYVAFEDGMGGFVPRDASVVFQKKYGDCKDMAFLIYSMLKYKNIDGYLTWIGSRDLPYSFTEVPTPITDNHMIACYREKNGNYIFLDATDKQIKYGFPSSFTQGKQGLIATQLQYKDTAYVPVMPYQRNVSTDSSFVRIENLEVKGHCVNYFTGYNRVNFINEVSYKAKQKKEEYFIEEFEKGNNKFFITNLKENFNYNDTTATLDFDFTIKDYVKKLNNEIYINLNLEQNTETYHLDETFTTPYNLEEKHTLKYVKVLDIPGNYKVE